MSTTTAPGNYGLNAITDRIAFCVQAMNFIGFSITQADGTENLVAKAMYLELNSRLDDSIAEFKAVVIAALNSGV